MDDLRALLDIARRAAALAGEVVMPLYTSALTVELKADRTPVTVADRRAEEAVREFLQREVPGHGVLGEEFGESAGDGRHRWILDPIDGTKSFIHRVPLFGTLVALERDGQPVIGVIACHATGETVYAAKGHGAFVDGMPVHVSPTTDITAATVSMTSYSRMARYHGEAFGRIIRTAGLARAWGDCYGYLMVATGRADVMLDPEMALWDVAALLPVITEAGGRLTTWEGRDGLGDSAIATNGRLHETVLALIHGQTA